MGTSAALKNVLKNHYKKDMISYIKSNPEYFKSLIKLAMSDDDVSWRASWFLWSCADENDHRIQPYIDEIIRDIQTKEEGHQRELLILLQKMELSENQISELFDFSMKLYVNIHNKPSIRLTALKLMTKISKPYPELKNEINFLIEPQFLETFPPASKKSVQKIINKLQSN